ncbi:beta-1,3-galactosyltransferase 1 [Parasteatoda tepidariorum]|uniref:beta-1,3-galactosyltransferase 1 n=1 Tax=Parasteatoda tepidariorum TaxID=114398 RepID=UPI001C719F85|nr:beta-1,3-galactosyltransferase 1 [Parasteatoda tepidariorum]
MHCRNIIIFSILIFLCITWMHYNLLTKKDSPSILLYQNLSHYVHPEKHTALILPKSQCTGDVFIVVVICSAVPNFESRSAIRRSWGQNGVSQRNTYFLLGRSPNDDINAAVATESRKYSDIIQEDFLDTYNNLTLKSVMLLKWVKEHCGNARYVMKTDDDMFVHVPNLVKALEIKMEPNLLLGCYLNDSIPNRDRSSKYYVPESFFPDQYYPPYLSGTGYVFSGDTVSGLYRASLEVEFFHLEDVFITGVCASRIGLQPRHDGRFLYKNDEKKKDCCTLQSLITAHKISPEELLQIWKACFQNNVVSCPSNANFISYSESFLIIFVMIVIYITI